MPQWMCQKLHNIKLVIANTCHDEHFCINYVACRDSEVTPFSRPVQSEKGVACESRHNHRATQRVGNDVKKMPKVQSLKLMAELWSSLIEVCSLLICSYTV